MVDVVGSPPTIRDQTILVWFQTWPPDLSSCGAVYIIARQVWQTCDDIKSHRNIQIDIPLAYRHVCFMHQNMTCGVVLSYYQHQRIISRRVDSHVEILPFYPLFSMELRDQEYLSGRNGPWDLTGLLLAWLTKFNAPSFGMLLHCQTKAGVENIPPFKIQQHVACSLQINLCLTFSPCLGSSKINVGEKVCFEIVIFCRIYG